MSASTALVRAQQKQRFSNSGSLRAMALMLAAFRLLFFWVNVSAPTDV